MPIVAPMPATAPAAPAGGRRELEVEAVWHEQLHQSKVSVLAFSADATCLWSGCDAAAPTRKPHGDEASVVAVSCKDGSNLHSAGSMPVSNVRLLRPLPGGREGLLCITGDGLMLALNADASTVMDSCTLPGTPAEAASAAPATPTPSDGAAASDEQQQAGVNGQATAAAGHDGAAAREEALSNATSAAVGPEFLEAAGYRGHREGYLFREGTKGAGYYRKDVARRYCAAAARGETTTRPAPAASNAVSSSDSAGGSSQAGAAAPDSEAEAAKQAAEEARQYIQSLLRAPPNMHAIVADPAGRLLFTSSLGSSDCAVRVWRLHWGGDCKDGSSTSCPRPQLAHTLVGHTESVLSLALSPAGDLLFSGSYDQTIRVWRTTDWHCLRVLKGHGGGVRALAVAPDGGMLYSAAADNTIRAWATRHWVCLRTMHGRHEDTTWPACLALSADGALLASGSTGPLGASTIKVFQTGAGGGREAGTSLASFAQLRYDQKAGMSALLFSPDGSTLYSGASDGTVAAWRLGWKAARNPGGMRKGFL